MEHNSLKLMCMAVSENSEKIVFLRKIKEGASENSYGIHVAKLAGIPEKVINRAQEILLKLQQVAGDKVTVDSNFETENDEKKSIQNNYMSSKLPGLFCDEELVIDEILSCDVENLTPLQSLQMIARWKSSLSGR